MLVHDDGSAPCRAAVADGARPDRAREAEARGREIRRAREAEIERGTRADPGARAVVLRVHDHLRERTLGARVAQRSAQREELGALGGRGASIRLVAGDLGIGLPIVEPLLQLRARRRDVGRGSRELAVSRDQDDELFVPMTVQQRVELAQISPGKRSLDELGVANGAALRPQVGRELGANGVAKRRVADPDAGPEHRARSEPRRPRVGGRELRQHGERAR